MARLTNVLRQSIADRAAKELFAAPLLELFKTVEKQIADLAKSAYKNFNYEGAKPYREYINWHKEIYIQHIPKEWQITWCDFRREVCDLPSTEYFNLPFEIPSNSGSKVYFDGAHEKQATSILRSYMVKYLTAREAYENMQQVLLGISTFKQLEETLPELVKYLPKDQTESVTALVPIEQINKVKALFRKN